MRMKIGRTFCSRFDFGKITNPAAEQYATLWHGSQLSLFMFS